MVNKYEINCPICNSTLVVTTEIIEDIETDMSDEGVQFEDVWFCTECYEEMLKGINIDPVKILNEEVVDGF